MRAAVLSLVSMLAVGVPLSAQPPGGNGGAGLVRPAGAGNVQPPLDPNNRLDALLMQWEKSMEGVDSILVTDCERTDKDKNGIKVWKGEARYLKPNYAALRMILKEDPKFFELVVCNGNFLYEYRPQFKKRVIHELPPNRAGAFEKNLLSFLFGMGAIDAKRRYELTLTKDATKENPHYIYIGIKPRFAEDKREFSQAQIVFFAATMLPRRLWYETPNGSEVTWDLPNMDKTVKLKPSDFTPPEKPAGWEDQKQPISTGNSTSPTDPRVVRPNPGK